MYLFFSNIGPKLCFFLFFFLSITVTAQRKRAVDCSSQSVICFCFVRIIEGILLVTVKFCAMWSICHVNPSTFYWRPMCCPNSRTHQMSERFWVDCIRLDYSVTGAAWGSEKGKLIGQQTLLTFMQGFILKPQIFSIWKKIAPDPPIPLMPSPLFC